jgi:hypothetical protein
MREKTSLNKRMRRAQSILEYAILLVIVSAAFLTMSLYIRRAVQARLTQVDQMNAPKGNISTADFGWGWNWGGWFFT